MMSRKVNPVEALGRAAAGSVMSAATRTQICSLGPCVLYVDRGVIVLNKPPGLVSQATAPSHSHSSSRTQFPDLNISRRNGHPPRAAAALPPQFIFDDVLDGRSNVFMRCDPTEEMISVGHHAFGLFNCRTPAEVWPEYESISSPSIRQGTRRGCTFAAE
jgi:hypothetical protein